MASFDSELDALFKTSAKAAPPAPPVPGPSTSKPTDAQKKRKADSSDDARKAKKTKSKSVTDAAADVPAKVKTSKKRAAALSDSDDSDDNADVEEAYAARVKPTSRPATTTSTAKSDADSDSEDSDADAPPPVHESLLNKKEKRDRGRKKDKVRYVPPGETREQRDSRTVFVGNVPVEVVKSKSGKKQLERHVLSLVPGAKIESTRFRSVAFATPTGLTTDSPAPTSTATTPQTAQEKADTRAHGSARAAHWRSEQPEDAARKKLTPAEKKKIAFIRQEVHEQASAVHAYIVFAHFDPSSTTSTPSSTPHLDPYEAATLAVEKVDGTSFMGRTLRVDAVLKEAKEKRSDPKRTAFVGNLDFATKDEDLRVYFEGVVSAERGPPGDEGSDSEEDDEEEGEKKEGGKTRSWVRHVRVVRDKDTQLGKGFAYVEFADRECVDELLAMEEGKLKFAKRKLRLQRCKTLPGSAPIKKPEPKSINKPAPPITVGKPTDAGYKPRLSTTKPISLADIPKGDPRLGERLKDLDKDARKAVKAADAERVARRMAKKKVRGALGLKVKEGDKEGKKRVRERKNVVERKSEGRHKPVAKKGRVRSEKSVAKRNGKK
ncbi:hypothetical protein PENSPDRAFT_736696 [Peniophora sp. CONT]|nr:hypothetical protein PENSPDRAFT_736696 [Peniophora sp. CONT]